jgi:hypothetical protein
MTMKERLETLETWSKSSPERVGGGGPIVKYTEQVEGERHYEVKPPPPISPYFWKNRKIGPEVFNYFFLSWITRFSTYLL